MGTFFPLDAAPEHWIWLSISGVIGLVIGDAFLFQAFVLVGPRISMLMMSLAPVLAAIQAWLFFDETLSIGQIFGISITLAGIIWVVMEKGGNGEKDRNYTRGILYGLGGAFGQATGLILAKNGLGNDFSAISASLIRMLAAIIVLWGATFFQKQIKSTLKTLINDRKGTGLAVLGAFSGPFIGVTLSMLSIQHAEIGVASTLMALPPVILLPISYFFFNEKFGWGAVAGTLLAMAGVAFLFLV